MFTPIFRYMTFLVVFGAVSIAPHSGGHVLVYVRVPSPLVQMTCWSRDRVALLTYPG